MNFTLYILTNYKRMIYFTSDDLFQILKYYLINLL